MQIEDDRVRRKSETRQLTLETAGRGVRDDRRIHPPAEISCRGQIVQREFSSLGVDRPSTVGSNQPRPQKSSGHHGFFSESCSSYFPRIHESYVSRDLREQKARIRSARTRLLAVGAGDAGRGSFATARGRLQSVNLSTAQRTKDQMTITQRLDCEGIESLHRGFEQLGHMDEEEFVTEMMSGLRADQEEDDDRVGIAGQLSELFRKIDLHARGLITWSDFSEFISQTTDVASALEDTAIHKYQADSTPPPINFVAEIQGLIYLPGADQMVVHDTRGKGFYLYDSSVHRIRSASTPKSSHGAIFDAVYTPYGQYVITASASPVLSFYDIESLQVRQQIPTQFFQTALALHTGPTSSNLLYSASSDGEVHAWDLSSLSHRHAFFGNRLASQSASITDLELLPANAQLACGSMDGNIYMLDLTAGRVAHTMSGHTKGISIIKYCAENKYLVSGGIDHKLQVWNPHLEQKVGSLPGHRHQLVGLHVRPDSPEVITADASGVMKVWDLRKFAAVQTIVKELYLKDHHSTAGRSMTAMCYLDSQQRIAIAHSSIFFLDPHRTKRAEPDSSSVTRLSQTIRDSELENEKEEGDKPLHVSFNPPSRSFIAITRWCVLSWDAATGNRSRSTLIPLGLEVVSVAVMQDGYSCFVGCDDGSIARIVLPSAAVVARKRVHKSGEVSSIRLLDDFRLVLSSGNHGNVIVSDMATLEPKHILNHWRGIHSVRSITGASPVTRADSLSEFYSVPLELRSFFIGNEIERLVQAFASADPNRSGKVSLSLLPEILERAFPSSRSRRPPKDGFEADPGRVFLTFAMFVEAVKDALVKAQTEGKGLSQSKISAFDAHPKLNTIFTASSDEDDFCVWNLKNAAVIGEGRMSAKSTADNQTTTSSSEKTPRNEPVSISSVCYLHPLPFFLCVESNSPRLSIWSSLATPPLTFQANVCILRYSHTHSRTTELRSRASTFMTEPNTVAKPFESKPGGLNEGIAVRTVEWFYSELDDKKLLCIGDDAGHVQLLDVKPMLRRIEEMKKHRLSVGPSSLRSPSTPGVDQHNEGLPPTLLQKVHRWSTTQHDGVGVRFVHIENVEHLVQPNPNKHMLVVSVDDIGAVKLWSFDGQLLGCLYDESSPALLRSQWKLRLDASELKQKTQESAVAMLRQVDQRQSISMNQHENERRQSHTNPTPPASRNRLLSVDQAEREDRTSTLPEAEKLRRSTLPARPSGMSAEAKLVAWRQSMTKTNGLQSRRTLRVCTGDTTKAPSASNAVPTNESMDSRDHS